MTIIRKINGQDVNIELSREEQRSVYEELQAEYDRDDVQSYIDCEIDWLLDEYDNMTEEKIRAAVPEIAEAYRRAICKGAFDWWAVAADAVSDVLSEQEA